jgi:hypothetical protein
MTSTFFNTAPRPDPGTGPDLVGRHRPAGTVLPFDEGAADA